MTRVRTDIIDRIKVLEMLVKRPRAKEFVAEIRAEVERLRARVEELEQDKEIKS